MAVFTARRMELAQLGVAMEPVRSMSCPRTMTGIAGAGALASAFLLESHSAAPGVEIVPELVPVVEEAA